MYSDYILLHPNDNVIVALKNYSQGEKIRFGSKEIVLTSRIEFGHKIAIQKIAGGDAILKYGYPIGRAICDINPGDWVHTQNLISNLKNMK